MTRELPFEGPRGCFPVVLKIKQSFGQAFKVCEIIGVQNLALDYGEIDLDLIEPTGVDGRVNQQESRITSLQALDGFGPEMRRKRRPGAGRKIGCGEKPRTAA